MTSQPIRRPSKKWSIVAWASASALSVILSYLLMLAIALVCLSLPLALIRPDSGAAFSNLLLSAFGLVMGLTILWSLIPRRDKFVPPGVEIDLTEQTNLSQEIQAIAAALDEPLPAHVYLTADANAFVAQQGGIAGIGSRRIMGVGLPLLQTLSVSQFRAVLAHEFAHFYSGDTRLGPWVFTARAAILRVVKNLGNSSPVLQFLARFGVIALLYTLIMKGLILYWKVFMRLTQFIARRQEFRSDELACHIAGSDALIEGLKTVNKAGIAVRAYWDTVVGPIVQNGRQPALAEGFGQFMLTPQISAAAAGFLAGQMNNPQTSPFDTHPPLNARIEKARSLGNATPDSDNRPAVSLLANLNNLELALLEKLAPNLTSTQLRPLAWETVGDEVYVPGWRNQIAEFLPVLAESKVGALPDLLRDLVPIAAKLKDPPGLLLTRDQRIERAAGVIRSAFTLALLDHGWTLHAQPGYFFIEKNDLRLEPAILLAKLRSGEFTREAWSVYCEKAGIAGWPLAQQANAAPV